MAFWMALWAFESKLILCVGANSYCLAVSHLQTCHWIVDAEALVRSGRRSIYTANHWTLTKIHWLKHLMFRSVTYTTRHTT